MKNKIIKVNKIEPFELENANDWIKNFRMCEEGKIWAERNMNDLIKCAQEEGRHVAFIKILQEFLDKDNLSWAEWYIINRMSDPDDITSFANYLISQLSPKPTSFVKEGKKYLKTLEGKELISKLWGFVLKSNIENDPTTDLNKLKRGFVEFVISMLNDNG